MVYKHGQLKKRKRETKRIERGSKRGEQVNHQGIPRDSGESPARPSNAKNGWKRSDDEEEEKEKENWEEGEKEDRNRMRTIWVWLKSASCSQAFVHFQECMEIRSVVKPAQCLTVLQSCAYTWSSMPLPPKKLAVATAINFCKPERASRFTKLETMATSIWNCWLWFHSCDRHTVECLE